MFFHIIAAMVWVGGLVAITVLATSALRSSQADTVARFVGNLRIIARCCSPPAMAVVLGLGIWMVVDSTLFQSRAAILSQRARWPQVTKAKRRVSSAGGRGGCA